MMRMAMMKESIWWQLILKSLNKTMLALRVEERTTLKTMRGTTASLRNGVDLNLLNLIQLLSEMQTAGI